MSGQLIFLNVPSIFDFEPGPLPKTATACHPTHSNSEHQPLKSSPDRTTRQRIRCDRVRCYSRRLSWLSIVRKHCGFPRAHCPQGLPYPRCHRPGCSCIYPSTRCSSAFAVLETSSRYSACRQTDTRRPHVYESQGARDHFAARLLAIQSAVVGIFIDATCFRACFAACGPDVFSFLFAPETTFFLSLHVCCAPLSITISIVI